MAYPVLNNWSAVQSAPPISKNDLIQIQYAVDEYRAKFKHRDMTPFAWHFKGNKLQGWEGCDIVGSCVRPTDVMVSPVLVTGDDIGCTITCNADVYKYFSMMVTVEGHEDAEATLSYYSDEETVAGSVSLICPAGGPYIIAHDLSSEANYTGTIYQITLSFSCNVLIQYVKIDSIQTIYIDERRVVEAQYFNTILNGVEEVSNPPRAPTTQRTNKIDLRTNLAKVGKPTSKKKLRNLLTALENIYQSAYNGCAACDINTQTCTVAYGMVGCATCNTCNGYTACSCDMSCYEESVRCRCEPASYGVHCTCNQTAHTACTCNTTQYSTGYGAEVTATWEATCTYTYRDRQNASTYGWRGDPEDNYEGWHPWIYHGAFRDEDVNPIYPDYGLHRGFIFFDTANIRATLAGAQILKVRLYIKRAATPHGQVNGGRVKFNLHNYGPDIYETPLPDIRTYQPPSKYFANPTELLKYGPQVMPNTGWFATNGSGYIAGTDTPDGSIYTTWPRGTARWIVLPLWYGTKIRDGEAQGIVLHTNITEEDTGIDNVKRTRSYNYNKSYMYFCSSPMSAGAKKHWPSYVKWWEPAKLEITYKPLLCGCYTSKYNQCLCNMAKYGYSCTCDGTDIASRVCTCNQAAYGATPCSVCDITNDGYSACTCNIGCYEDTCRDCHNTGYHT